MGFRLSISEEWAQIFEAGVGVMLIALGLSAGWALWSERVHVHVHVHGDGPGHLHVHSHRDGPEHTHLHRYRTEYKSLAVGMVHGLAGSAAVLLLLLPAVSSVTAGVIYILAFGAGSIAGMMAIGAAISMPFTAGAGGLVRTHRMIRALAGLASIALGSGILYEFILKAGLPSGQ